MVAETNMQRQEFNEIAVAREYAYQVGQLLKNKLGKILVKANNYYPTSTITEGVEYSIEFNVTNVSTGITTTSIISYVATSTDGVQEVLEQLGQYTEDTFTEALSAQVYTDYTSDSDMYMTITPRDGYYTNLVTTINMSSDDEKVWTESDIPACYLADGKQPESSLPRVVITTLPQNTLVDRMEESTEIVDGVEREFTSSYINYSINLTCEAGSTEEVMRTGVSSQNILNTFRRMMTNEIIKKGIQNSINSVCYPLSTITPLPKSAYTQWMDASASIGSFSCVDVYYPENEAGWIDTVVVNSTYERGTASDDAYDSIDKTITVSVDVNNSYKDYDYTTTVDAILEETPLTDFEFTVDGLTVTVNTLSTVEEEFHFGEEYIFVGTSGSYTFPESGTYQVYIAGGVVKEVQVVELDDFTWASTGNQVSFFNPTGNTGNWTIDGVTYTSSDPIVELVNGVYIVELEGANSQTIEIDYTEVIVETEGDIDFTLNGNVITVVRPEDSVGLDVDYGDNTITQELAHEYAQHGEYTITIGTHQITVTVQSQELPVLGDISIVVGDPNSKELTISFPDAPSGLDYLYTIDGTEYTSSVAVHEVVMPIDALSTTIDFSCRVINEYGNASFYSQEDYEVLEVNVLPTLDLFITRSARTITCTTTNVEDSDGSTSDIIYTWDMGDTVAGEYLSGSSTTGDPVYEYAESGSYQDVTVTLTIEDIRGGTNTYTKDLRIYDVEELDTPSLMVNGDFSTDDISGFTRSSSSVEIVDNVLEITSTSGSSGRINIPLVLEIGELYKVDVEYYVDVASNQSMKNFLGFTNSPTTTLNSTNTTTLEREVVYVTADEVTGNVSLYAGSVGNVLYVNEIKINKVL